MGLACQSSSDGVLVQERKLVKRCQAGEREAFNEIVRSYQKKVLNLAYHFLGDYSEAVDLTQDAFIKAYLSIKRFRGDSSFYTWLYRITINLCKNKLKYRQRRGYYQKRSLDEPLELEEGNLKFELAADRPNPGEVAVNKERSEIIRRAIDSLDEGHRVVLILRDREMFNYEEIAKVLKCQVGTVKSRLHRARLMLKEKLVMSKIV